MVIYNSLTSKKETFVPLNKDFIKMYVCGITPYDTTHLGHAFLYSFFDTFKRFLIFKNYNVIYTQNVTDIDDDILRKSKEEGKNWKTLGNYWTKKFLKDTTELNILKPTNYIKATDHISQIIEICKELEKNGFAYLSNNNLYFNIKKFKEYGKLSRINNKNMLSLLNERGGNTKDPNKINPLDFILWQGHKKGEPFWKSPWGKGRPGWHIECSAMIFDTLGSQIDVHGGGKDLIFPHHESEIAQSEAFTHKTPFVKFWMHVGTVYYKKEKMSKSLKNLVLVSDLLKQFTAPEIRFFLLSKFYRSDWEFTFEEFEKYRVNYQNLNSTISKTHASKKPDSKVLKEFEFLMEDDIDIPKVLSLLVDLSNKSYINSIKPSLNIIFSVLGF